MIEIVEKKAVPIYEGECCECKSKFRFTRSETWSGMFNHIYCPVCGMHNCFDLEAECEVGYMESKE